jgi:hypothetical protein
LLELSLNLRDKLFAVAVKVALGVEKARLQFPPVILLDPGSFKLGLSLMIVTQSNH